MTASLEKHSSIIMLKHAVKYVVDIIFNCQQKHMIRKEIIRIFLN